MTHINIRKKDRKFKIKPEWVMKTQDEWEYYSIGGVRQQKIISKDMWNYYIIFEGDLEPFTLKTDKDHLQYFRAKDYKFAPSVFISHQDDDGFLHIRTEAGYFAIRFDTKK
jgi:hypothetical protein